MRDPYRVLDVARDADDAAIHAAYLELVRHHSPDRDPGQFERVRTAYEAIRDRRSRIAHALFGTEPPTVEELLAMLIERAAKTRPDAEELRRALARDVLAPGSESRSG